MDDSRDSNMRGGDDAAAPMLVLIHADAARKTLMREVIESLSARVVGCLGPMPADASALGDELQAAVLPDLRQAIQKESFDLLLLASSAEIDPDLHRVIGGCGVRAVSMTPWPDSFDAILSGELPVIPFAPRFQESPGGREALTLLSEFGPATAINMSLRYRPPDSSLFAGLYDCVDFAATVLGKCEQIDASRSTGDVAAAAESLRGLRGGITANLRFGRNRSACISVHEHEGPWFRGATVFAPGGALRVTDSACAGVDEPASPAKQLTPSELIAQQIRRLVANSAAAVTSAAHADRLAICEAARISCHTGASESAMRLREMVSRAFHA